MSQQEMEPGDNWITLSQQDLGISTDSALEVCWGCGQGQLDFISY